VLVEARRREPMVRLALFRSRTFSGTNLLTLFLYAALGGAFFFLPFDLIQVQGYSPAAAGASLLPFVLLVSAMSRWAGGLAVRTGARLPLLSGASIAAGGFALLARPTTGGSYWTTFFPGMIVLGLGMGLAVAPLTTAVMGSVDSKHAGVASGINNAVARAAGLLAVAALGVLMTERFGVALDGRLAGMSLPPSVAQVVEAERGKLAGADLSAPMSPALRTALREAFLDSYVAVIRTVMLACAGLAAIGAFFAGVLVEGKDARHVVR
jgi:hypothetical protein